MALNALLKRQAEIKATVETLEGKFRKVSDANRKAVYFKKRLSELCEICDEFERNDEAIKEIEEESTERKVYDDNNVFDEITELMKKMRNMYEEAFKKKFPERKVDDLYDEREAADAGERGESKGEGVTRKTYAIRSLTLSGLASKLMGKIDDTSTVIEMEYELKKIEAAMENYMRAYEAMVLLAEDDYELEGMALEHEDVTNIADRVIILCKGKIASALQRKNTEPEAPKLQALKVPKFKGECGQWVPFLNLFSKVVRDNMKLSDVQKLQYLLDSLEAEPRRLVQHLDICDKNFDAAMEILMRRYNDQRRIVNNHVDALLDVTAAADDARSLKVIYDTVMESLYALKGQNVHEKKLGEVILVRLIEKKLDGRTRQHFEESLSEKRKIPKLDTLLQFIEERFISMESVAGDQIMRRETVGQAVKGSNKKECIVCRGPHGIHQCVKFNKMTPHERNDAIRKANLCRNCLRGHNGKCNLSANCNKCKGFHHVALHYERRQENGRIEQRQEVQTHVINAEKNGFDVMLATAIIRAKNEDGEWIELRALIDQGSTVSFISEEFAQRMRLKRVRNSTIVTGIGASKTDAIQGSSNVCIKPRYPSTFETSVEVLILNKLTTYENAVNEKWSHVKELALADPEYWRSSGIDMILGADIFGIIVLDGVIRGPMNTPIAQETVLGWILSGRVKRKTPQQTVVSLISSASLENQLEAFWKIEEMKGDETKSLTKEESMCEEIFTRTTRRNMDGKYITRLPFRATDVGLGRSRHIAVATLLQMERRFKRDPQLKSEYAKCINEYLELDHMELAKETDEALTSIKGGEKCYECYYLPHHAVMKTTSTTTKLRVVFNASQKSSNGISLNELMLVGPTIQDDLMNILVRWRGHRIALAADIEKMYRQIHVDKDDYNYQRIVWRNDEREPIRDYCIKRVTFGNASAPFVAIRTIKQLAKDEKSNFPEAAKTAESDFYVDDLITGTHTVVEARELQRQMRTMMESGGMNLRKWASNEVSALDGIPNEHRELKNDISIDANTTLKMLGVQWEPVNDVFLYKIELNAEQGHYTKRELVSEVARIFDPLGWLSPVVIMAKMRLQETWLLGVGWDQQIPDEMAVEWNKFKATLRGANTITLPRYMGLGFNDVQYELHGFCDASMKAYAAAVYLRAKQMDGKVEVYLIAAKSRVAPTKTISLPRLELCGAVLLANLMTKIKRALNVDFDTYAWTDSMITLAWITGDAHRWETFVANRTTMILENIAGDKWRHVGTKDNPADVASRGLDAIALKDCAIWWHGPEWLREAQIVTKQQNFVTSEGVRKTTALHTTLDTHYNDVIGRFSSLDKLKRVIAYCIRFGKNCRGKRMSGHVTVPEIRVATTALIRWAQTVDFEAEIGALRKNEQVKSGIAALNPFIDEKDEVLRVGGRIRSENLSYTRRHPAILAYSNVLVVLIIRDAHMKTLHGGNTLTLAYIRQQYWIMKAKRAVKWVVRRCLKCVRFRAEMQQQQMGNLPVQRTTEARPFLFTGVDFCGPFDIKSSGGRGIKSTKGYVAVFICLVTKAIHIEAVSDLTSRAFIAALRRMISRRGHIARLFSDNGTNFVGANKMIRDEYRAFLKDYQDEVTSELTKLGMEWQFIPPSAPNFGGLWEAGVKSVKYHLKRTMGDAMLTYEELTTSLYQIEACLNSRPLCAMTEDPNELVLTPAHFLVGESLLLQPEADIEDGPRSRIQRWQMCQKIQQDFWRSWRDEYLTRLQQRTKWLTERRNLQKDDVVLVKDERTPSSVWPLGRITETYGGKDGLVRVVDVRIGRKTFRRPVTKICLLPVRDEEQIPPPGRDAERNSTSISLGRTGAANHAYSLGTILFIMALISCVMGRAMGSFSIEKIKRGPAIYFEKIGQSAIMEGQWSVLAYYDLDPYFEEFDRINDGILHWKQRCLDMEIDCNQLALQFAHRIQIIRGKNELMTMEHHGQRKKRAVLAALIGGVALGGMAYHWLTTRESSSYAESIRTLKTNQDHLLELIQRQTSVLDITANVMRDNFEQLSKEHADIRRELYQMVDILRREDAAWKLHDAASQYTLMLEAYADVQNRIIDAFTNVSNGRLHPTLVPADQLRTQLDEIMKQLPAGLRLPGEGRNEMVRHVYRTAKIKTGISDGKLIFRVAIPLLRTTPFWIWRVVPIPMMINGEFVQIQSINEYMLVDNDNSTYYDLGRSELRQCTDDDEQVICELHHPLYKYGAERGRCEMKFLRNEGRNESDCHTRNVRAEESWIQLDNLRTWIFTMDRMRNYTTVCEDYNTSYALTGTGLLTFTGNCSIEGEQIHLASNQLRTKLTTGFLATTDVQLNFTGLDLTISNSTMAIDMTELDTGLQELHTETGAELLGIRLDNGQNYYVIFGLAAMTIGVIMTCGSLAVVIYWKKRGNTSRPGECTELQMRTPHHEIFV